MTALASAVEEYLAIRHSLGIRCRVPAGLLRRFVTFVDRTGSNVITRDLAVQWAMQSRAVQPATWAWRLGIVRRFALWRQATDPRTEVPPAGLLPHRFRRPRPHLYTDAEIRALLTAARALPSPRGLRGLTYATLFGLLAATGLRVSEALALDDADVALDIDLLTIRRTKFGKSRIVPVHRSTTEALTQYAETRDRLLRRRLTPAFFVAERGTRLGGDNTRHTFALVSRQTGLRTPPAGCRHGHGPRLHDLRQHAGSRIMPGSVWEQCSWRVYGSIRRLPSRHNPAVFFRTARWPRTEETCWITSSRIATRFGSCDRR